MEEQNNQAWKTKIILAGTIIGAVTGFVAALVMTQRAEKKGQQLAISSGQGVKIGMLLLGLLRSITHLDD